MDETKSVGRVPKRKKGSSPDDQRENKLVCTHDQAVDLINANFVMSGKTINLCLKNIHGDNLSRLSIESTALCAHVAAHAAATKKGCIAMLMAGQMYLKSDCSLEQQGVTEDADITCVFSKSQVLNIEKSSALGSNILGKNFKVRILRFGIR